MKILLTVIEYVDSIEYLGVVIIDNNLRFDEYIGYIYVIKKGSL